MTDDDLRFGDVSGSENSGPNDILDWFIQIFIGLILLYVLLRVVEILFNIPIPFV
jgi:hypothetical protein